MIDNKIIKAISDKGMDRKDFLKYSGVVLLSLVGLKTIISILSQSDNHKITVAESQQQAVRGFGGGKYGS
ncbi:MAG: hypothetical protein WA087_01195 [Candidatus Saccharimonadales bacterium]